MGVNLGTIVVDIGGGTGGGNGGTAAQVALLSITTAPSGTFAVGSKYYDLATKKILTAITANTWTGATSADPVLQTIYTYDGGYYIWDGDSLEPTDLNLYEKVANKTDTYSGSSSDLYVSQKGVNDGLETKVDKETGKGLSANDFTDEEKEKLANKSTLKPYDITVKPNTDNITGLSIISNDTPNVLDKADIPLTYDDILTRYNGAEQELGDDTKLASKVSSDNAIVQQVGDKIYFLIESNPRHIYSSENLDLSSPALVFNTGDDYQYPVFFIGQNINVVQTRTATPKIRIYSKAWELLQEYDNDYGLAASSGAYSPKFYKSNGNIYLTTLGGVVEIPDNAAVYTPVFYNLGKMVHTIAYFKSNWFLGTTDNLTAYAANAYYKTSSLASLGTQIAKRDNIQNGERPLIAHNDDYIVLQFVRNGPVSPETFINYSSDGETWQQVNVNSLPYTSHSYLQGTMDNKFIIYGAKLGITLTSNPFGEYMAVDTAETYFVDANGAYNAISNSNGLAFSSGNGTWTYSPLGKKVYTQDGVDYYLGTGGVKIALPTQDTAMAALWTNKGNVPFFRLDTSDETLTLPRQKIYYSYMQLLDTDFIETAAATIGDFERFAKISEVLADTITDLETENIVISNVIAGMVYQYGEIDSLEITNVDISNRKSIIYFSTSADFTDFTPPTGQTFIGSGTIIAEKNYKIEIENGIMEIKEYSVLS